MPTRLFFLPRAMWEMWGQIMQIMNRAKTGAKGIITREMSKTSSNWRSEKSFITFLKENKVTWIEGIDTRKLTRHIRKNGTQKGCIIVGEIDPDLAKV